MKVWERSDVSLALIDSGRGAARAEDAQGTPTQSHISSSIQVYEEKSLAFRSGRRDFYSRLCLCLSAYRGTSLIRNRNPPRVGRLLMSEVTLYLSVCPSLRSDPAPHSGLRRVNKFIEIDVFASPATAPLPHPRLPHPPHQHPLPQRAAWPS